MNSLVIGIAVKANEFKDIR